MEHRRPWPPGAAGLNHRPGPCADGGGHPHRDATGDGCSHPNPHADAAHTRSDTGPNSEADACTHPCTYSPTDAGANPRADP